MIETHLRRIQRDATGLATRLYLSTLRLNPDEPKVVKKVAERLRANGVEVMVQDDQSAHDAPDDGRSSQPGGRTRSRQDQPDSAGPADSDNSTVPAP
jgi:hypothetical protein